METRGSLIVEAAGALAAAGFEEPRRHARRLVSEVLAISQTELFGHPDHAVGRLQAGRVREILGRMVAGEPLSRILGRREFWGLKFVLSADTLDPRPETEIVVEAVLSRKLDREGPQRLLDLGTGTGCLLLTLLTEFPAASGVGVDIADGAVRTAGRNAFLLGLADRAHFFVGDWTRAISGKFDTIVTNPPYIARHAFPLLPRAVASYDPWLALDGGQDGLRSYWKIAEAAPELLSPHGIVAAEVGVGQADAVAAIMALNGLLVDGVENDLSGIPRCVVARFAPYGR